MANGDGSGELARERGKPRCNRFSRSPDQGERGGGVSQRHARGRTGSSPAHPFGSLATSHTRASLAGLIARGPWLCVPASRRVCPFEDERRFDPGATPRLAPGDRHQNWRPRLPSKCTAQPICEQTRRKFLIDIPDELESGEQAFHVSPLPPFTTSPYFPGRHALTQSAELGNRHGVAPPRWNAGGVYIQARTERRTHV